MRRIAALVSVCLAALVVSAAAHAVADTPDFKLTPIARLPFPERGYIVYLPESAAIHSGQVRVTENGREVEPFAFTPVGASGIRYGVVLAVDTSESMAGDPIVGAMEAARTFVAQRGENQRVGFMTFDGTVRVRTPPTLGTESLNRAVATTPPLAYGTRIYDAAERALSLLRSERIAAGAIILMSDGADVGSRTTLEAVLRRARAQQVRIFTVGLRSGAFEPGPLNKLAAQTGGRYAEAASSEELASIYRSLGRQLTTEYVLQYRSEAAPKSNVAVRVTLPGFDNAVHAYTAPTPSALPPYHRSLLSRFLLSPLSLTVLALLGAAVAAMIVMLLVERSRTHLVERVNLFVDGPTEPAPAGTARRRRVARMREAGTEKARGLLTSLDRDLDIANIEVSAIRFASWTLMATALLVVILSFVSPAAAVAALATPVVPRAYVKRRVKQVRNQFADQLAPNLQVLASALRAGHSFNAALAVTVENAHEPSRREFRRAVTDEQFGVLMDEAIRRVAIRMQNRDLEQVALLAELQRTTGGNAAEVLDVVVFTVRERADIRRLVRTLTAQGRMARWILTALPIVTALAGFVIQPDIMGEFASSTSGQFGFAFAALLVAIGSFAIQRIVDIEV